MDRTRGWRGFELRIVAAVVGALALGSAPSAAADQTLTVQTTGTGAGGVTGPGINCPGDCTEEFADGAIVNLSANSFGSDSVFAGWFNACTGTGACQITMDSEKLATAQFSDIKTLGVSIEGPGVGRVTGPGIDCPGDCEGRYVQGQQVTIQATPGPGSTFTSWTGVLCGGDTSPTCSPVMVDDRYTSANFGLVATSTPTSVLTTPQQQTKKKKKKKKKKRKKKGLSAS